MDTQQNQNEIKKKGVQVNPSRDIKYENERQEGEQLDADSGEEVSPSELDSSEVELDRGGVEFSGGNEQKAQEGSAQGYEGNSPDVGMSSDLGGDMSRTSGQASGSNLGNKQGTQKTANQNVKQNQDNSLRQ